MRSSEFSGSRPTRVTRYTTGANTHTLLTTPCWCRVTAVGGGGAGGRPTTGSAGAAGAGGGGGQTVVSWVRFDANPTYAVGDAAATTTSVGNGLNGNATTCGPVFAQGGFGGATSNATYGGGLLTGVGTAAVGVAGGAGGAGGSSGANAGAAGSAAGFGYAGTATANGERIVAGGAASTNAGGGGGGCSLYGTGGVGGAGSNGGTAGSGSAGTGYGGGGGGGGNAGAGTSGNGGAGSGGLVLIEEFGNVGGA